MRSADVRLATLLLVLMALLSAAAVMHAYQLGRALPIAEPGTERLDCVSYSPFRLPGQSPFDPKAHVSEARIEADLRILAARTGCVRTYSVQHGLHAVPRVARRLGMEVMLGAWIGRDRRANDVELATAIGVARVNADVVRALVIGNEVMLRRELPESELVGYIEWVREEVPVPVTYADVWEFWLKHPTIAPAVSFVTIHVLPYWEDEPVGIDAAVPHVVDIYRRMQAELPGRRLLIGETGWPSAGRARREAVPGRVEQARFVREFSRVARDEAIPYNLIEGFDQPWKRALEGAMGGNWGIYDSAGQPKFDWHGPVAQRPEWRDGLWAALAAAAVGAVALGAAGAFGRTVGAEPRNRRRIALLHALCGALAGAGLGAVLAEHWNYLQVWNRGPLEWIATSAATACSVLFTAAATLLLARRISSRNAAGAALESGPLTLPPAAAVLRDWRRDERHPRLAGWVSLLLVAVLFAAAVTVLLHAFDARYRGFPWPLFAGPIAALALLRIAGLRAHLYAVEERWLAGVIAAGAVVMVVSEGPANPQALGYAAAMGLFALCAAWPRTSTSRASSAPTAAGSKL
jgi:exo-beta-1,3-glucanase (GH17 family)